ncbi:MAG: hypothetical protein LBD82_05945, partial [Deltaproteobacteria bacterium]|nr:hypothetical protein [Deltaproteobacteria bacterium]
MTRADYFARQRALSRLALEAEAAQSRLIRKAHMEAWLPFIAALRRGMAPRFDGAALAEKISAIIRGEGAKPALAARALHTEMEAEIFERLGIPVQTNRNGLQRQKASGETETLAYFKKRLNVSSLREIQANARAPRQTKIPGRAWAVSAG